MAFSTENTSPSTGSSAIPELGPMQELKGTWDRNSKVKRRNWADKKESNGLEHWER